MAIVKLYVFCRFVCYILKVKNTNHWEFHIRKGLTCAHETNSPVHTRFFHILTHLYTCTIWSHLYTQDWVTLCVIPQTVCISEKSFACTTELFFACTTEVLSFHIKLSCFAGFQHYFDGKTLEIMALISYLCVCKRYNMYLFVFWLIYININYLFIFDTICILTHFWLIHILRCLSFLYHYVMSHDMYRKLS